MNPMTQQEMESAFETLREQAIVLRQTFNTFDTLFSADLKIENILRKSAAWFFDDLNSIMIEYLILLICRLTDPPETAGNTNLTIPWMTEVVCEHADRDVMSKILKIDECLRNFGQSLRPIRNKIISHIDRETYMYERSLGDHSEKETREFFDNLQKYFDAVGIAIGVGPLDFLNSSCQGDVHDLIKVLRQGLEFADSRK